MAKSVDFGNRLLGPSLDSPPISCVALDQLFNLFVPQFLY